MTKNRIDQTFERLKKQNRKAFIPYITAGYPDIKTTKILVQKFEKIGCDIVELGVPFSDPIADGPVIQMASQKALEKGVSLKIIIQMVKELREKIKIPIVLMAYYNPIFVYGIKKFVQDATKNGVDGVIIPDLPPEEAQEIIDIAKKYSLNTIFLLTPTSSKKRIRIVAKKGTGFIYYVSVVGVTGERKELPEQLVEEIKFIKSLTHRPICVGFGISNPQQAKTLAQHCDGVIVGSAIVKKIQENVHSKDILGKTAFFVEGLLRAVKS
ncbi:tryptophan synthase subunit alpha [bacterium Unc6]|nr:tryptophan synthase subunit alpha [bacterium Unc6]